MNKNEIAVQLLKILHESNLSGVIDITKDEMYNDLDSSNADQDNLFGDIANALIHLGYSNLYERYLDTGSLDYCLSLLKSDLYAL